MTPPTPITLKPIVERKAEEVPAAAPVSEEKKEVSASDPTIKAPLADAQEAKTIKLSPADIPAQEAAAEKVEEAATPKAPVQESVIEDTRQTIEAPAEKSKIGLLKPGERSSDKSEDKPAENAPAEKTEAPAKKPAPVKKPRSAYNSDDSVSPVFLVSSIIALLLVLGLAAITYVQYSNIFNGTNIQIPGL